MIRPTRRSLWLWSGGVVFAGLPTVFSVEWYSVWLAYVLVVMLASIADVFALLPVRRLRVVPDAPDNIAIGESGVLSVELVVERWWPPRSFRMLVDLDAELEAQPEVEVSAQEGPAVAKFRLEPRRRGELALHRLWLRWQGPLGLVSRTMRVPLDRHVVVTPNIRSVREAALRFFSSRDFLSGLKIERYLGDGSEFESLREFVAGFDQRAIDWKASARHRQLLCRQFQAERNHQVVIAFDSGYLMREPLDGVPRLDHAISAGLLLSYVCLRTGDKVGMFQFDESIRNYVDPQGGAHAIHRLQQHCAAMDYTSAETNFTLGLAELQLRLRRRSLVVILTDFVDTITAELMVENLQRLARRHLVLFVTVRDPGMERETRRRPKSILDLNEMVIVNGMLQEREVLHRRLTRAGIHCVDAVPGQITAGMINRYLDIRRKELI